MSLHYNGDESYLYMNETEICKFKGHNNIPWYELCFGSVTKDFTKDEVRGISLNGSVYDFSVDHSPIEKKIYLIFISI